MATPQQGFLLIADITGYTTYLSESELEHAQGTLRSLLELLIDHTRPPLIISRLAGDAVISYSLQDHFYQGQTFIEMIEETYVAFRKAIERMVLNNTCRCNACANVASLDLKFFVHYGRFAIQRLRAHEELVGSDVNLIHRLLKNRVTERTGWRAYTLYTSAALHQLGIEDVSATMASHTEETEPSVEVQLWVQDMHSVWAAKKDQRQVLLAPENILMQVETEIHLPSELVWDYLIQPEHFNVFAGGTRTEIAHRKNGRVTVGSVYQCYHGDTVFPQTILEWQPFERILIHVLAPVPVKETYLPIELRTESTPNGTRFVQVFGKAFGSLQGRVMANLMFRRMEKVAQRDIEAFKEHIEADFARRAVAPKGLTVTSEMVGAAAAESLAG